MICIYEPQTRNQTDKLPIRYNYEENKSKLGAPWTRLRRTPR